MRPAHRTIIRGAIMAAVWVILVWRFAKPDWLTSPEGRIWGLADDVYITADYARTFASGQGPLWYPGAPRVEGFSSPLWMFLLTPFHLLPASAEPLLGLYVVGLDAAFLIATAWLLSRLLEPIFERVHAERVRGPLTWVFAVLAPLAAGSLCGWAGEGFEVGPVALLSVWSFAEALEPADRLRERRLGVLLALAFFTRMDALVSCAPALVLTLWKLRRSRRSLLLFAASFAGPVSFFLFARYWYFGDFLPNTYYLKLAGWPLSKRLGPGLFQNILTLRYYGYVGLPFLLLSYLTLAAEARQYLVGLLAPALTLLYSTHNGGDFEWVVLGFDRHSAPALPLLVFTLGAILFSVRASPARMTGLTALALVLAMGPVWTQMNPFVVTANPRLGRLLNPFNEIPENPFLKLYIFDARLLERVTKPHTRIALCAAGAIIYFSHRDGVDILGKNDPYIAHLPAADRPGPDSRCFRSFAPSGHNKEDMHGTFALHMPEVSLMKPPVPFIADYVSFIVDGRLFYGRRHSRYILWRKVKHVTNLI